MQTKKLLPIGLVSMLILTMIMVNVGPVSAAPDQIGLTPSSKEGTYVCESFNLNVWVNVTGMAGFEYQVYWERKYLNVTARVDTAPAAWTSPSWLGPGIQWNFNATHGRYWRGCANLPAIAVTGNFTLATLTFHVEYQPYFPETDHSEYIKFYYPGWPYPAKISNIAGGAIPHTAVNCLYTIKTKLPPTPKLEVIDPVDLNNKFVGEPVGPIPCGGLFDVDIKIKDLAAALDLCGWEAKLSFNNTMLTAVGYKNGTFFNPFKGPNGTYPICNINNTSGIVHMADLLLGNHTKPYGAGTLMTIIFNASWQYVVPPGVPPVKCALDLHNTKLANSTSGPINHTVNDGEYEAPYKTAGWALDCYTQSERKKCTTPYTGIGINMTADAYEPQDLVILYAKLDFNKEPECYKMVMFEVYGPRNPYYNLSIIRTAWTNCSGIATINFTIPGSGEPWWYEMVHGKWVCYQAAQVKEDPGSGVYKPSDWLFFEVGWIVEILNVTVTVPQGQNGVKKCQYIEITIWYKNIMMIPKDVLFTVIAIDYLLDPIQEETWWVRVPAAEYGPVNPVPGFPGVKASNPIPFYNFTIELSHIPKWAHVGQATVYVNAFTNFPRLCGCPYCPEVTATFWIIPTSDP